MKVIGIRNVDFKAPDGNQITGYSLFCSYPITQNGEGEAVDKVFISDRKMHDAGYYPEVGDEVRIQYNRYGKVDSISPVGV